MKKLIASLILFLMMSTPVMGAVSIRAEWSAYTPPLLTTVTGFNLYQDGVLACNTKNPLATSIECSVNIVNLSTVYTLSATFADGKESPKSTPFNYNYTPVLVAPTELRVITN